MEIKDEPTNDNIEGTEACTPEPIHSQKEGSLKKSQMSKKGACVVRNPSALKSKNQPQIPQARIAKQASVKRLVKCKKSLLLFLSSGLYLYDLC